MIPHSPTRALVLLLAVAMLFSGCASKGLLVDRYEDKQITVPKLLPDDTSAMNPRFIVIGDEQMGRRAVEKFYREENWSTWWQLAVPFYQIYLLYNGISGAVNYLRHVPDYGDETRMMMREVLYRDVQRYNADFILNTGDMAAADGRYPSHWEVFLEGKLWEHPFLHEIPYLPTIGNHEWANDTTFAWPNYQAVFEYPRFYVQEFEHAVVIVLDSNFLVDQWELIDDARQGQLFREWFVSGEESSWLEETLAQYDDKRYKIISMHHPPITYGWHWVDWYKDHFGPELVQKRQQLLEVFARHEVDVVFSGHEHIYQHSPAVVGNEQNHRLIHFVTSSGGGVPIRDLPDEDQVTELRELYASEGIDARPPIMLDSYHYCLVSMDADSLVIETMEVDHEGEEHETSLFERIVVAAE